MTFHNKESGESRQIITDVVQVTGRPVQQAMSGDAVYVRDPQDQQHGYYKTTVTGIIPYKLQGEQGTAPVKRLITSAHLIDYEESRVGEMLHHPDETTPFCAITGIHHVTKYRRRLKPEEVKDASFNRLDILYADVHQSATPSANINGTREPEVGDEFTMTGSSSGVHRGTVTSTLEVIESRGKDSKGKYYTYWKDMAKYEVATQVTPGDSGAGLIAENDKNLIGIHSFRNEKTDSKSSTETDSSDSSCDLESETVKTETFSYACQLY